MTADVRHARPGILARLTGRTPAARRQRDPIAGAPPVPCGRNAHGWPLVRDATGVRPATGGEMAGPHGIATRETLERLVAEAEAQAPPAAPPWGPWDEPGSFPDALRAEALSDEDRRWYGWDTTVMDNPPVHARPYAPEPPPFPVPSLLGDLGDLPLFRDTVRDELDRRDRCARPSRRAGGSWQARYAGLYLRTMTLPEAPDFRISEMMHAHYAGMLAMHVTERAA